MIRKLFRVNEDRGTWCEVTIEIKRAPNTGKERLTITGDTGYFTSRTLAKKDALNYWEFYFEEVPEEMKRLGKRTALSAARFVLATDGELHGLDVHKDDGKRVYITTACGQIREEIAEFFPEVVGLFQWHLNDVRAGCEHQEARGETWQNAPSAVCPECGWKLGHGWNYRPLPDGIRDTVERLAA